MPGGGTSRGKCFDIINAALAAEECFDDTEDYKALLNAPIFVKVGTYTNKKSGKEVNCVDGVGSMGKKAKDKLEDSTVDNVFFDCYSDDEGYKETYAGLGNFVQKLLKDAKDTEYIPAIKDNWPTSIEEKKEEDSGNEF